MLIKIFFFQLSIYRKLAIFRSLANILFENYVRDCQIAENAHTFTSHKPQFFPNSIIMFVRDTKLGFLYKLQSIFITVPMFS